MEWIEGNYSFGILAKNYSFGDEEIGMWVRNSGTKEGISLFISQRGKKKLAASGGMWGKNKLFTTMFGAFEFLVFDKMSTQSGMANRMWQLAIQSNHAC